MNAGQVLAAGLLVHMDLISSYSRNQESKKGTGIGGVDSQIPPSFFFSPSLMSVGTCAQMYVSSQAHLPAYFSEG